MAMQLWSSSFVVLHLAYYLWRLYLVFQESLSSFLKIIMLKYLCKTHKSLLVIEYIFYYNPRANNINK